MSENTQCDWNENKPYCQTCIDNRAQRERMSAAAGCYKSKSKKMNRFDQGILHAAAQMIALHDEPTMAANVIREAGLTNADCTKLDEYEKTYLRKMKDENGINFRGL